MVYMEMLIVSDLSKSALMSSDSGPRGPGSTGIRSSQLLSSLLPLPLAAVLCRSQAVRLKTTLHVYVCFHYTVFIFHMFARIALGEMRGQGRESEHAAASSAVT